MPTPVNKANVVINIDSSLVPRRKAMPLQAQISGTVPHTPLPSSDKTKPSRATNGVPTTAAPDYTGMMTEHGAHHLRRALDPDDDRCRE